MGTKLTNIRVRGFRSIIDASEAGIHLENMNVLLGANGAGKSNLLAFFALLNAVMEGRLGVFVGSAGGASAQLTGGPKRTPVLSAMLTFESDKGTNEYGFTLAHAANDTLLFTEEHCAYQSPVHPTPQRIDLGAGHFESRMRSASLQEGPEANTVRFIRNTMLGWRYYHFHDTSPTAGFMQQAELGDNLHLYADASNLGPILHRLRDEAASAYGTIRSTVQLAAPFFDDFVLEPEGPHGTRLRLRWRQKGDEHVFHAHQLSDGTLRFICLATLCLQPAPPRMIILDEPELGLHPYAIQLLAAMLRQASDQAQVVIATQSVPLVDALNQLEDLIVVDRTSGGSRFRRIEGHSLDQWLAEYTVGQLWTKNLLGGGPRS